METCWNLIYTVFYSICHAFSRYWIDEYAPCQNVHKFISGLAANIENNKQSRLQYIYLSSVEMCVVFFGWNCYWKAYNVISPTANFMTASKRKFTLHKKWLKNLSLKSSRILYSKLFQFKMKRWTSSTILKCSNKIYYMINQ